jgi:hypothetical protein
MTKNNINFVGISSLRSRNDAEGKPRLQSRQFLHVDNARKSPGGLGAVEARFQSQPFAPALRQIKGRQPM